MNVQSKGLAVLAIRAYLRESRQMTERTLYRVLRRLVKRGVLVNTPTQDRGALYALTPAEFVAKMEVWSVLLSRRA